VIRTSEVPSTGCRSFFLDFIADKENRQSARVLLFVKVRDTTTWPL